MHEAQTNATANAIPFSPTDLVNAALIIVQHKLNEQNLTLRLHMAAHIPDQLQGNPRVLMDSLLDFLLPAIHEYHDCELHLTVHAISYIDKGTAVDVRAELRPDCNDLICQPAPAASVSGNILIVDDNPVHQVIAQGLLQDLGFSVTLANHGQEAIGCWLEQTFDMILMDCEMPVLDGYATTRIIREQESRDYSRIPVIALSAHGLNELRQKTVNAGMNDYIVKPLTREKLQAVIAHYLHVTDLRHDKSA